MNRFVPETCSKGVPISAGTIAINCKITFPPADNLDSVADPGSHGLLASRAGAWLFDGLSVCPWHGGSEVVDAAFAFALKEFCRQEPPHCRCSSNAAMTSNEKTFIRTT
jgi:hypothetical protein